LAGRLVSSVQETMNTIIRKKDFQNLKGSLKGSQGDVSHRLTAAITVLVAGQL
jgi:hypothetical protein